jgi:hypothetical protein
MRRFAFIGALATAAVVAVLGVALGWWHGGARIERPSRPLETTATLSLRSVEFGDPLTARLDLLVDPREVDPAGIRIKPRFAPYRVTAAQRRVRRAGGVLISYRFALECLSPACVPGRAPVEKRFLPAFVSFPTRSGRVERLTVDWPSYLLVSRLTDADRANPTDRLHVDSTIAAVTYRVAPGTLRALLTAASAALLLLAAALTALALRRRAQPPVLAEPDLPPLSRALLFVHASTSNGFPDDRRKALSRLARELRVSEQPELARAAARLAWSAEPPSAEAAGTFASQVETELGGQA